MNYKHILFTVAVSVAAVEAVLAQSPSSQRLLRKAYKQPNPGHIAQALENQVRALEVDRLRAELHFFKQQLNVNSRAALVRAKAELAVAELEAGQRMQQAALEDQKVREAAKLEMAVRLANEAAANRVEVDIRQELTWSKALLRTRPELRNALQQAVGRNPRHVAQGLDVKLVRQMADALYEDVRANSRGLDFSHTAHARRYLDAIVRAAEQAGSGRNVALVQNP